MGCLVLLLCLCCCLLFFTHFYLTLFECTDLKKTMLKMTINMTVSLNLLQEHR